MSCDEHRDDLIDAAAGAAASSSLEAHLVDCPGCRNRLDQETALLTGFDLALRERLEAKPPATIQKRIAARVAAGRPATWSVRRAGVVAAGVGAVLALGWVVSRPLPVPGPSSAPGTVLPNAAKVAAEPNALALEMPAPSVTVRRVARSASRPAQGLAAAQGEPSVLVSPGQEEALRRFVTVLRDDPGSRRPLLMTAASVDRPMEPPPLLEIPPLDVPPLPAVERSSS